MIDQNVGELLARRADMSPALEACVDPEAGPAGTG